MTASTVIPRLDPSAALDGADAAYLAALRRSGFRGGVHSDLGTRLVHASDNSIYEALPRAVLRPRDESDLVRLMRLLGEPAFASVTVTSSPPRP